jgi:hypothetical protein
LLRRRERNRRTSRTPDPRQSCAKTILQLYRIRIQQTMTGQGGSVPRHGTLGKIRGWLVERASPLGMHPVLSGEVAQ